MLYTERVLHTANALPEECIGRICHKPVNAYRAATLIFLIKFKQHKLFPSRNTNRHSFIHILRDDRHTISSNSQKICLGKVFVLPFNLQYPEDHRFDTRQTHRSIKQFFLGLDIKTIKSKLSRPPQRLLHCAGAGYLQSLKFHNLANKYS